MAKLTENSKSFSAHMVNLFSYINSFNKKKVDVNELKARITEVFTSDTCNISDKKVNQYKAELNKLNNGPSLVKWVGDKALAGDGLSVIK